MVIGCVLLVNEAERIPTAMIDRLESSVDRVRGSRNEIWYLSSVGHQILTSSLQQFFGSTENHGDDEADEDPPRSSRHQFIFTGTTLEHTSRIRDEIRICFA